MKTKKKAIGIALSLTLIVAIGVSACNLSDAMNFEPIILTSDAEDNISESISFPQDDNTYISLGLPPLSAAPAISDTLVPSAPGTRVRRNESSEIDYSNSADGYVMIRFLRSTTKQLRVLVTTPGDLTYTYTLKQDRTFEVYPLSGGNGNYTVRVFEQVEGNRYSVVNSASITVAMTEEFAPFLRSNQYVNFAPRSKTVAKAAELVKDKDKFFDKVSAIYSFIMTHLTYDMEKARTVQSGYLPVLDKILEDGKGICFDYAALMTAMLRSQGIPTKLVVGYAGTAYHAWINVYSEETGWLDTVIFFDGEMWTLMDPTYASSGSAAAQRFIGDGTNYRAMFLY